MQRVTGIGGIFFKANDPKALGAWYRDHLGLDVTDWGGAIYRFLTKPWNDDELREHIRDAFRAHEQRGAVDDGY